MGAYSQGTATGFVGLDAQGPPAFILYAGKYDCTHAPHTAMLGSPLRARLGQGECKDLAGRAYGLHQ